MLIRRAQTKTKSQPAHQAPADPEKPKPAGKYLQRALTILLLVIAIAEAAELSRMRHDANGAIKAAANRSKEFSNWRDENGAFIARQQQTILTLKDALRAEVIEKEKWMSRPSAQIRSVERITIPNVTIPYHDTVLVKVDPDGNSFMRIPIRFGKKDTWYSISGTVTKAGVHIDSVSMNNRLRITIAYQKNGFLKRRTPVVEVKSSNPYSTIIKVDNVIIKKPYAKLPLRIIEGAGIYGLIRITKYLITK